MGSTKWNVQVPRDTCSPFLLLTSQFLKARKRELENVFHEISRYNVALHVPSVDGTFRDLGDLMSILILSVGHHMDWKNPRIGPWGRVIVNLH